MSHLINLSVANAWIKFREHQKGQGISLHKIPQLRTVKQSIAEKMFDNYLHQDHERPIFPQEDEDNKDPRSPRGRPPLKPVPSAALRQHGAI